MYYLNILYTLSLELNTYLEKDQLQDLTFERNHHQFQHQQRTFMHLQKFAKFAEVQAYMPPYLKTKNGHWFSFKGEGGGGVRAWFYTDYWGLPIKFMEFSYSLCSYYHICWLLLEKTYWRQFFLRCKLTSQEYNIKALVCKTQIRS